MNSSDVIFGKFSFIVIVWHQYETPRAIEEREIEVQFKQFPVVFDRIIELFEQC